MEKTSKRVSKRIIVASTLAVLLAVLTTSGSAGDGEIVKFEPVVFSVMTLDENKLLTIKEEQLTSKVEVVKVEVKKEQQEVNKDYSEEDVYWLSHIVSAEAKGESEKGKIAVANVVLNRVKHEGYPDSVKGVVFQGGQFSPVKAKTIYNEPTEEAVEASIKALEGEQVVNEDVLFFYNPKIAPKRSWLRTREEAVTIGNHRFTY